MYYICCSQQENLELGEKRKQQELLQQVSIVLPRNLCFLPNYRQGNLRNIPLLRCKLLLFLELRRDIAGAAKVVIENCVEIVCVEIVYHQVLEIPIPDQNDVFDFHYLCRLLVF